MTVSQRIAASDVLRSVLNRTSFGEQKFSCAGFGARSTQVVLKRQEKLCSMRRGDEQPCTLRRFARHSNVAGRRPIIRVALARSALDRSQMLLGDIAEHPRPSPEAVRVQFTTHPQLVFRLVFRRQGLRFGRRQGRRCVDLRTLPAVLPNGRPQCVDGFAGRGAEGLDPDLAHRRCKAACPCKHPEPRRAGDAEQPVTLDRRSRGAG